MFDGLDLLVLQVKDHLSYSSILNLCRRNDVEAPTSSYIAGEDELLASRHHDSISVATILTQFTILSYNEYCR